MFFFDVYCELLWFQPGTEDIKLVMFCFDWLTHSVRIGLQVIRLMFFSVFPMLGECYPGGIESRGQRKSGALVIDILQLSPLLAGLLSFLCSSVWTWFIFLSITLFKILEIMPSKWFFSSKISNFIGCISFDDLCKNHRKCICFYYPCLPSNWHL